MAWLCPPLRPDHDDRRVDHGLFQVGLIRQRIEYTLENIGFLPIAEPPERRVPVAEPLGQVALRTARAHDPQHRLRKQPVVLPATARVAWLTQTERLDLRPLGICQNIAIHPEYESHQTRL